MQKPKINYLDLCQYEISRNVGGVYRKFDSIIRPRGVTNYFDIEPINTDIELHAISAGSTGTSHRDCVKFNIEYIDSRTILPRILMRFYLKYGGRIVQISCDNRRLAALRYSYKK